MNTDKSIRNLLVAASPTSKLKHGALTEQVIGVFYDVYNELGYGFMESVYKEAMRLALGDAGLSVVTESPVPVWFKGTRIGEFRADMIVDNSVLLELKAVRVLERAHEAQLLHYLRATEIEVGLLLNFGVRPQFRRLLFDNDRKKIREKPCESVAEVLS
ncbi:MAG: GxxExxY protein [Terriglobales bacterium]